MSHKKRKKIPEHAPPPKSIGVPKQINNLYYDRLKKNELVYLPMIEYACKLDSHLDLYNQLLTEKLFLPEERCFTKEWAHVFLRGDKDFLPIESVAPVKPIYNEDLNWDLLKGLMNEPTTKRYFHWIETQNAEIRPDYPYIYRVLATVHEKFHEYMLNQGAGIFIHQDRLQWLRKLPSKEPNGRWGSRR